LGNKLTAKQERFCLEYMVDGNACAAARRAGYSEKTVGKNAYRLLKLPAVSARIEELNILIANKRIADAEEIMAALTAIIRRETCDWVIADKQVVEVVPKIADVVKASELLGRRYAMFRDKADAAVVPIVIVDDVGRATASAKV